MSPRRRVAFAVLVVAALATRNASGDIYHIESPSTLTTEKGSNLKLPPGYFLDEKTWQDRDAALKKLQDQSTRLTAENQSLRDSAVDHPYVLAGLGVLAAGLGAYLALR